MASVPAICDNCDLVFDARMASFGEGWEVNVGANRIKCPRCRAWGRTVEGIYRLVGETLEIFATSSKSVADLERLQEILRQAKKNRASPEAVADAIRRDAPGLEPLAKLLASTAPALFLALLQTILTAISLVVQLKQKEADTVVNVTVNNSITVEQVIKQTYIGEPQPRRNDPCPCKSGKRFKHCHGTLN